MIRLDRLCVVALLLGAGSAACQSDEQRVTLGSRSLWYSCQGSGRPVVMLEAGHSETSATWEALQARVASFTRVCRYDRAGRGHSDADTTQRRSASAVAADLHAVLARVDSLGPYLLVGHSLGGAFVRLYAAAHPDKIAGLILVDAVHERESEVIDGILTPDQRVRREQLRKALQANLSRMHPRGELVIANRSGHFVHHDQPDLVITAIRKLVTEWRDAPSTK